MLVVNPNFTKKGDLERSLVARGVSAKGWPDTCTEVEYLGESKFGASVTVGHRVFFDKADGNKPKKHKLTDERPGKDYVLVQGAKCCVEVHPAYAKYFDVQHSEVRLYEESWRVQRLFKAPDTWRDVDAYNPHMAVEEYPEPAGDVVKVAVTYTTDYGPLTVEYFQRDGNALKHNVSFKNTSGSTETFRVLRRWAGIVGAKCNGKDMPVVQDAPYLAFHSADKPQKQFTIAENLYSMVFNPDGSEKADQCLQRPISVEAHAQGMKADFVYGNWALGQNESLEIDPDSATLSDPTEDGHIRGTGPPGGPAASWDRHTAFGTVSFYYVVSPWEIRRGYVEWDISSIPGGSTVTKVEFRYEGSVNPVTDNCWIYAMANQPTAQSDDDAGNKVIWDDAADGVAYLANDAVFPEVGATKDVGGAAGPVWDVDPKGDVETALGVGWFALGFKNSEVTTGDIAGFYSEEKTEPAPTPKPTLYVEYTPPAAGLENKSANMAAKMMAAGLI